MRGFPARNKIITNRATGECATGRFLGFTCA